MSSMIEGYKKAKELGIRYIFGVESYETSDMSYKEPDADRYHLILLAKSEKGLKNLFRIVSESYTRGFYGKPRTDLALLNKYSEGIICLSSCLASRLSRALVKARCSCCSDDVVECLNGEPDWQLALKYVEEYKMVFGDNFYIELQSHDTEAQTLANQRLLKLALETNTRYTITFDTHLRDGSDLQRDIHAKFLKIGDGREAKEIYSGCWQQTMEEVHEIMDKQIGYEYVEIAIDTSDYIAEQCNVEYELHQDLMPHIEIPKQFKNEQDYLKHLVRQGWIERDFKNRLTSEQKKIYKQRIEEEFEVLDYLGYCSYFIMTKQLIDKFKEREIPLNYGRGSAAGCLILYVLGITEVDSVRWDLDFSRFANRGRKGSVADIDVDVSKRRRQEALDITVEMFGRENVAQVATFNSLSPKVCIRDLGKVFHHEGIYNLPNTIRDNIAKLVPDDPNEKMTIEKAMELNPDLLKYAKEYPLLFEYTKYLQNLPKSIGTHASAVLITPKPIVEFAPIMLNKDENIMSHLEMHNAMDDIGQTKLDLLGLNSLDVVDDALKFSGLTWKDVDINTLELDDKDVLREIYSKGNTLGVFQMEKQTCIEMFQGMDEVTIEDVFAICSLNRPATLSIGMDKIYLHNKRHPEDAKYIHDDLKPIFERTNAICLYQEQALKVFGLAGFDESERDVARRAISKKKADVMAKLWEQFKDGLLSRSWNEEQIKEIWDLIEAQSTYSFNASHSLSYGLLSYLTAYLKYHYPKEFMTALLISEIGNYQETTKYINEARRMGINVVEPDINKSQREYSIDGGNILFGLESLKGVGTSATTTILEERANKQFDNLEDFINRCNVGKTTTIALIKSGAFGSNKDEMLTEYANLLFEKREFKPVKSFPKKATMLELRLIKTDEDFKDKETCLSKYNEYKHSLFIEEQQRRYDKHMSEFKEKYMSNPEMYEFSTLSIFLHGHPLDKYLEIFTPFEDAEDGDIKMIGGTISEIQNKKQKNGQKFVFINILTPHGVAECTVFASNFTKYQQMITRGNNIIVKARRSGKSFIVDKMKTLESWEREMREKGIIK